MQNILMFYMFYMFYMDSQKRFCNWEYQDGFDCFRYWEIGSLGVSPPPTLRAGMNMWITFIAFATWRSGD